VPREAVAEQAGRGQHRWGWTPGPERSTARRGSGRVEGKGKGERDGSSPWLDDQFRTEVVQSLCVFDTVDFAIV
jgi:hypothetical protein